MTPTQIAQRVIARAKEKTRHASFLQDELAKEIAQAISEERELISRYLMFLNESIAQEPQLVRHRLVAGSARISTGRFLEEMHPGEHRSYTLRLNTARAAYYAQD